MVHEPSTNSDAECGELMDGRGCLNMDGTMVEERRCFCNMAPLSLYLYIYICWSRSKRTKKIMWPDVKVQSGSVLFWFI